MFYVANNILHDECLSEDVVSESLLKIAANYDKISSPVCQETKRFVVIVTERTAIDYLRKEKRLYTTSIEDHFDDIALEPASVNEIGLYEAIDSLPPDYRDIILLKFGVGLTNREIALMRGYSISKVEKIICRGKKKLHTLLRR